MFSKVSELVLKVEIHHDAAKEDILDHLNCLHREFSGYFPDKTVENCH